MIAGFYSPLPPARTGVADYSQALLEALRKRGEVRANADGAVNLYHVGNNQLHGAIYERALAQPGVVVLHDAVLQHFMLGRLGEAAYVEEFTYNYGAWMVDLARRLYRRRGNSASDEEYFQHPMLRRIAGSARAVVVHNRAAARMVLEHAPEARVVEIPHLFAVPDLPGLDAVAAYRERLGIPREATVFGVFGHLRESKRVLSVLRAFHRLDREAYLLVAGECVSADLRRAAEKLLRHARIRRLPYLAEEEFWLAACATDCCINLRHPAAGEASGIAIRFMGIGKCTMLSDILENQGYPEDSCLRVAPGIGEEFGICENMNLTVSFPEIRRHLGLRASQYIRQEHALDRVADLYWKLLCESL